MTTLSSKFLSKDCKVDRQAAICWYSGNSGAVKVLREGLAVGQVKEIQGATSLLELHELPLEQAG